MTATDQAHKIFEYVEKKEFIWHCYTEDIIDKDETFKLIHNLEREYYNVLTAIHNWEPFAIHWARIKKSALEVGNGNSNYPDYPETKGW